MKDLYDAGNELNTTTGVYETMFRGYDPALGRFMQVDPLALYSHTLTPYHYAANNPVNFNDPTGLQVPLSSLSQSQQNALYRTSGGYMSYDDYGDWAYDYSASAWGGDWVEQTTYTWVAHHNPRYQKDGHNYTPGHWEVVATMSVFVPMMRDDFFDGRTGNSSSQTQDVPNVDKRLASFVSHYFGGLTKQIKSNQLVVKADYQFKYTSLATPGVTIPLDHPDYIPGQVQIFVNPLVLLDGQDPKMAYMIIGHELIHGIDQDAGIEMELSLRFGMDEGRAILETHAYIWNIIAAKAIGFDNSVLRDNVRFYARMIPSDFDYNVWFGR